MAEPSGTRAMLTAQIAAQIAQQTGDRAAAEEKAVAIVEDKHRKTVGALYIGALTLILGGASYALHFKEIVTLCIVGGGLGGAGIGMDPEYAKAWAKNFADVIGTISGAIRKAFGLGGA